MWRFAFLAVVGTGFAGWSLVGPAAGHGHAPAAELIPATFSTAVLTAVETSGDTVSANFEVTAPEPLDFRCLRIDVVGPDGTHRDLAHLQRTHVEGALQLSGPPAHLAPGEYVAQVVGSRDGLTWNSIGAPEHFTVEAR